MRNKDVAAPAARAALKRALSSTFCAGDLSDLLTPVGVHDPLSKVRAMMEERDIHVVAVAELGEAIGWLSRRDLSDEAIEQNVPMQQLLHSFSDSEVISDRASIKEVIEALDRNDPVFVEVMGETAAVLTHDDLQEAPMRMWLFGLVTLVETILTHIIDSALTEAEWTTLISPQRLSYAQRLQEERKRRHQDVPLIECLQFADKGNIVLKGRQIHTKEVFSSRRQGQEFFSRMETLRDCLAHNQVLPTEDLEMLIGLASNLEELVDFASAEIDRSENTLPSPAQPKPLPEQV